METEKFTPALTRVFGSRARTKLIAVLVERSDECLTAAELCDLADVSQSGFHRDHKSVLINFGLVERRDSGGSRRAPEYTLADTRQAEHATKFHYALQSELENSATLLEEDVSTFVK